MGKRIERVVALTIVLLYQISYANITSAGMLPISSNGSANSNLESTVNTDTFFDKILSWNFSRPESSGFDEGITEEPQDKYEVIRESVRQVTAYNVGDVYQNDSTPCTGAYSRVDLCEELEKGVNVCAANFVPLHTMLRIYTDEGQSFECIVWDRMNSRYPNRVDIAMSYEEKIEARQFGLQRLTVQVLKEAVN